MKKICANCKHSEKAEELLVCKKNSQDVYIADGYGIEVMPTVGANDTCDKWRKGGCL